MDGMDDRTLDKTLTDELLPLVKRLTRDLAKAAATLSDAEARFMVDAYYQMQDNRIRTDGQIRSMDIEPNELLTWLSVQSLTLESQIKRALGRYVEAHPMGEWMEGVHGIGPIISAGMLAHIDIHKAPTVGHIWRYAGLDPTSKWEKGKKRPWNASLKVLCWKAGESFVKFSGSEKCFYGRIWREYKERITAKNEAGDYAAQAAEILTAKKFGKDTEAFQHLSGGKLPPAQIHARARRYAVKLFLSHLHGEMYRVILGTEPPLPYPIGILGHAHFIKPSG